MSDAKTARDRILRLVLDHFKDEDFLRIDRAIDRAISDAAAQQMERASPSVITHAPMDFDICYPDAISVKWRQ